MSHIASLQCYLTISDTQTSVKLCSFLLNLSIEIPANSFSDPWLVIIIHASLFLWISSHVRHGLQVSGLGLEPFVDEQLRILGETQEEFSAGLQTVDGLQCIINLNINVIASCFLCLCLFQLLHADGVVDDNWIWRMKKRIQTLRNLCKLHPLRLKNLLEIRVTIDELLLVLILEFVGLDVLPQGGDDHGPRLGVDTQQPRQPLVQLEL